jgi:ADP-L-glycero-D-manno-heptose 6-epimerase
MFIVTGGAGFIGSALVWGLNKRGQEGILIVDSVTDDEMEHNLAPLRYETIISGNRFRQKLAQGEYASGDVEAVFHMGAISSTTERDWHKFQDVNIDFSQEVIRWCSDQGVRCVYASSGATYGDGAKGYSDDHALFDQLRPLNLYGRSKLMVDVWARDAGYLNKVAGLRYFNVFGPNEWHKGNMRSVIAKQFDAVHAGQPIRLFKSYNSDYGDGDSVRDFVYVKDVVRATLFFLDSPDAVGIFNVGSGRARSWNDVARAVFEALATRPSIEYVDMPEALRAQYQYFTQAEIAKLKQAGFRDMFVGLEDAVADYVKNHLISHKHLGGGS